MEFNNIMPLLALLAEGGNIADKIRATLKAGGSGKALRAIGHALLITDELAMLTTVDWSLVDDEWKASRAESHVTIARKIKEKFNLEDDKAEEIIEEGAELLGLADTFISKIVVWAQKIGKAV